MPPLSRLAIRLSFIYLLLGVSYGALMLANKGVPFLPALWQGLPAHIEFLFLGWVVQLVMGTAFWILPRTWTPPRRGDERPAAVALVLLNAGIWLVIAGAALVHEPWLTAAGRALETAAVVAFAVHAWPRIVSREGTP